MKYGSKLSWLIVAIGVILGFTGVSVAGTSNRSASSLTPSPTAQVAGESIENTPLPSVESSIAPAPSPIPSPSPSPTSKPSPSPKVVKSPTPKPSPVKPSPTPTPTPAPVTQNNSTDDVDYYTNSEGNKVQSPTHYDSPPAGASAQCKDGTYSFSQSRRGTCSGHEGVAQWL